MKSFGGILIEIGIWRTCELMFFRLQMAGSCMPISISCRIILLYLHADT